MKKNLTQEDILQALEIILDVLVETHSGYERWGISPRERLNEAQEILGVGDFEEVEAEFNEVEEN